MKAKEAVKRAKLQHELQGLDRTEDLITKEQSRLRDATTVLDKIAFLSHEDGNKDVETFINSMFFDDKSSFSKNSQASTQMESNYQSSLTVNRKISGFFSAVFDERESFGLQRRTFENLDDSIYIEGKKDKHYIESKETIKVRSFLKSEVLKNLATFNGLSSAQLAALQDYYEVGDNLEKIVDNSGAFIKLGSSDHFLANVKLMKKGDSSKINFTNRPMLSSRNAGGKSRLLPKNITENKHSETGTSLTDKKPTSIFKLLVDSKKIFYNDTYTRNNMMKAKKMILKGINQPGQNNQGGAVDLVDDEDLMIESQFPIQVSLDFQALSPYCLNFFKKFISNYILKAYVTEFTRSRQSAFELNSIPWKELDNEGGWNLHNEAAAVRNAALLEIQSSLQEKRNEQLRSLRNFRHNPFRNCKKLFEEEDYLKVKAKAPNGLYSTPPYLKMEANKYRYKQKTSAEKIFAIYEFRLFWFDSSSSVAAGYVDLRNCVIGLAQPIPDMHVLSLHPRNNGNTLCVVLDESGQALRKELVEVKAWAEVYDWQFLDILATKKTNQLYTAIDGSSPQTQRLQVEVKLQPQNLYCDAWFVRQLVVKGANVSHFSLEYVIFSPKGIERLKDLFSTAKAIEYASFSHNYFDEESLEQLLTALLEKSGEKINTLRICNNKVHEQAIQIIFETLNKHKSSPLSAPLKELTFSQAGLVDSSILGLQNFLNKYSHEDSPFRMDLSSNYLSDRGLMIISELLMRFPYVSYLDLSNQHALDHNKNNIKSLLDKLTFNKSVQHLNFSNNGSSTESVQSLLNYLGNNTSITTVMADVISEQCSKIKPSIYEHSLKVFGYALST